MAHIAFAPPDDDDASTRAARPFNPFKHRILTPASIVVVALERWTSRSRQSSSSIVVVNRGLSSHARARGRRGRGQGQGDDDEDDDVVVVDSAVVVGASVRRSSAAARIRIIAHPVIHPSIGDAVDDDGACARGVGARGWRRGRRMRARCA